MTPADKAQWINALRSGDYKQGVGALFQRSSNQYCCLGVLGDLHDLVDGKGRLRNPKDHNYCFLPRALLDGVAQSYLVDMNDQEGKSFAEIADWIEENV